MRRHRLRHRHRHHLSGHARLGGHRRRHGPKALTAARPKATAAGVTPRFVEGDVTRLHDLGVGDGYTLLLDFGCFHTLPEDRRPAYVTSVRVAAPGATLLLCGFKRPPKAAPCYRQD
ncbi:MAG TPA: class I SAM-dependent methyltransferase [Mycobacterium sp.]|nr:class I SAM-dependent methyltransferase [Mycobacterium sp.]